MEITSTMLYLITRLDNISVMSFIIMVMGVIGVIIGTLICIEFIETGKKTFKYSMITAIIFSLIAILTPTTKEMAAILILPRIINNDSIAIATVQKDSGELYGLAVEKLKEMLETEEKIEN